MKKHLGKHLLALLLCSGLLIFFMVLPFFPGRFDLLALPLSILVQVIGIAGLPLPLIGLLWLIWPKYRFGCAVAALIAGIFLLLVLSLIAVLSVGYSVGLILFSAGLFVLIRILPELKALRSAEQTLQAFPVYLLAIPLISFLSQLFLATPMTVQSRNRAISQAAELIKNIEEYHQKNGIYPPSLQAQYMDVNPGVVGVEKFHYALQGQGYNLYFEQPRFLLDDFGTREWVVYNPKDEQRMYSHAAWLLSTKFDDPPQGWYASGETGFLHWKYFYFD